MEEKKNIRIGFGLAYELLNWSNCVIVESENDRNL